MKVNLLPFQPVKKKKIIITLVELKKVIFKLTLLSQSKAHFLLNKCFFLASGWVYDLLKVLLTRPSFLTAFTLIYLRCSASLLRKFPRLNPHFQASQIRFSLSFHDCLLLRWLPLSLQHRELPLSVWRRLNEILKLNSLWMETTCLWSHYKLGPLTRLLSLHGVETLY